MLRAPQAAARRGPTSSRPHFATQEPPENRIDLYSSSPNPYLAAGEPLAGKRPVKPRLPSLTLAEDLGLEFEEAQGAVYKPKTHMNSARRDLFVIVCCDL